MRRVGSIAKRLLWIVLLLVVVLIAAGSAFLGLVTMRALPQTSGSIAIPGLGKPVTVDRDASGIAWIQADTPHDLFLAQGYVHAQERMWQMEVWRHISAGRLSELFGKSTLSEDRFIRTLGWRQSAARDLEALSPDARAVVDAYAEGVNAWLAEHKGSLGLAFVVAGMKAGIGGIGGYDPEPWTALDTMAWQKVQAWQLGGNYDTEIFRMLADAKLGDPALTDELFPAYGEEMPVITPSGLKGSGGAGATAAAPSPASAPVSASVPGAANAGSVATAIGDPAAWRDLAAVGGRILDIAGLDGGDGIAGDHQVGSNNWVVAPSKSGSKAALLANDPHLGIGMPSVWFINGLRCRAIGPSCPYNVVGVSFPGVPGVILGHNDHIAWGATNVDPDVEDLFAIDPDPANPVAYLHAGTSLPFKIRHETIKVAGGQPVDLAVRETVDGPIVNGVEDRLAEGAPLLALRWTATDDVDGTLESLFRVTTAADFKQFRAAFAGYGAPSQNFVYADVNGHIGYVLPGRIPIRADPADHGARVRSGSDGKHDWIGTIPTKDLPWQLDPPTGMIVTANNAAVDARYPYFVAQEWDPGYRAKRVSELLATAAADGGVTVRDLRTIQLDTKVLRADAVVPIVATVGPATDDGVLLQSRIVGWNDRSCPIDSVDCAAYLAFEYRLIRGLFDDELGSLAREYVGGTASWQAMIALLATPASAWWDDTTTPDRHETRDDIVAVALDSAGRDLRTAYGDSGNWTWGTVHTATFREATLGSSGIGPLEWYLDKGPYPAPGAAGAINNTYYRPSRAYADPNDPTYRPVAINGVFEVTNLPSYRLAIDMSDLDGARIVQTTGQSGNPFDTHYGDLIDDWLHGDSVPLPFSLAAIHDASIQQLRLVPKPAP